MQNQNYKNHRRLVPLYHYGLYMAVLALIVGSVINFTHSADQNRYSASLLILVSVVLLLITFYARAFAVKAQDRAINAEENLRYFILTGKPIDSRVTVSQKIALRFAADDEFVALTQKALDENLSQEQIKKEIKNWKGDHYRV